MVLKLCLGRVHIQVYCRESSVPSVMPNTEGKKTLGV